MLDRCLLIELERIGAKDRQTERRFWESFEISKAGILGAIFDAIVYALAAGDAKLPELPRMADYCEMGFLLADGLGIGGNVFLRAFEANTEKTINAAMLSSPVAVCLFELLSTCGGRFSGTSSRLFEQIRNVAYDIGLGAAIPKSATWLTKSLRLIMTDLRASGINIDEETDGHSKQTSFRISRRTDGASAAEGQEMKRMII